MATKQIDAFDPLVSSEKTTQLAVQDSITKVTKKILLRREGYEDLMPSEGATPGGASAPSLISFGVHEMLSFSGTADRRLTYKYHLPHDFVEGSDIFMHIHHFASAATPAGQIDWKVYCQYAQGYGFGAYSGTDLTETISVDLTGIAQNTHLISEGVAINDASVGSVLRTDGVFIVTLERQGSSDSSSDEATFLEMDLHYLSDGTKTVNKNDTGSGFTKV